VLQLRACSWSDLSYLLLWVLLVIKFKYGIKILFPYLFGDIYYTSQFYRIFKGILAHMIPEIFRMEVWNLKSSIFVHIHFLLFQSALVYCALIHFPHGVTGFKEKDNIGISSEKEKVKSLPAS
jgi:hypothetical protein